MTLQEIAQGLNAHRRGTGFRSQCPVHGGSQNVFSIHEEDGRILVHCFAGCPQKEVIDKLASLGLWAGRPKLSREDWIRVQKLKAFVEHLDRVKEAALDADDIPHWTAACRAQRTAQKRLEALGVSTRQREPEVSEQLRETVRLFMQAERERQSLA